MKMKEKAILAMNEMDYYDEIIWDWYYDEAQDWLFGIISVDVVRPDGVECSLFIPIPAGFGGNSLMAAMSVSILALNARNAIDDMLSTNKFPFMEISELLDKFRQETGVKLASAFEACRMLAVECEGREEQSFAE